MSEDHDATLSAAEPGDPSAGATARPTAPEPETLGRFQLRSLIGEGGMGQVWEAWDPRLERRVAIKRLHAPDPRARQRFLREARLQASLAHPGICPVFEVGQAEGLPYIVMPRLEGEPLDRASEDLPLEQRLILVRQVAEAVHAAHRAGLIHRDLKPANILVESPDDGPSRPMVLDFGIARPLAEEGLTASGELVGTPSYMAPEQVEGDAERLDRRTDVYALGATLYRLLTGRPPHAGQGATLMVRILRDEPPRLRPTGVPVDVEAIVFKCLEKTRERRYDSALALAEDLGRYLDGEPVRARRIDWRVRLVKGLRRHRVAVRVAAVAAVLLVAALGWGIWSASRAEERQRLAARFGAQVEAVEATVRFSRLAPLHDVRPDQTELRRLLASIHPSLEATEPSVRALAHHALGQGHLALDELDEARRHLESAWELGHQTPESAADLGRALSELYRDRLASLERVGDLGGSETLRERLSQRLGRTFGAPDEQQKQLQRSLGDPARELLARGRSSETNDEPMLEALILFHEGRPADALELLRDAPADPSWVYEPLGLEGDIRRSWAVALDAGGDEEAARRELESARRAYAEAARIAESDPAILRDDAQVVYLMVRLGLTEPDEVQELIAEGLERLEEARIVDPDDPRAWVDSARLHRLAAEHDGEQDGDPGSHLDRAIADGRRALAIDEESSGAWYELGRSHWRRARRARDLGNDPLPLFEEAGRAFERVAPEARDYAYFTSLGLLRMTLAGQRAEAGLDAGAEYGAAIEAYRAAAERHSAPFAALVNLGVSLRNASTLVGTSPVEMLRQAVETFEQARDLDPDHMVPPYYLGLCYLGLAQGGNPASERLDATLAQHAAAELERAVELAPEQAPPHIGLGKIFHFQALDAYARGADPTPFFERARRAQARALERAPGQPAAVLNQAWTVYFEGKFALRDGGDPEALLTEAEHLCQRALEIRRRANALLCLGSVRRLQAEYLVIENGVDGAAPRFAESRQLFEEILSLDPDHAEAHRSLGRLLTLEAQSLRTRGEDSAGALERARQTLDRALALESSIPMFWLADARWHLELAEGLVAMDQADAASLAASISAGHQSLERAREPATHSVEIARLEARFAKLNPAR